MSENRPTEWQWKTPEGGKIDGLTREEWENRGVVVFARRDGLYELPYCHKAYKGSRFSPNVQYAPATLDGLPAAWPAKMPVVVIPAAEMTALVLYGHQAMGGTWRRRCDGVMNGLWGRAMEFTSPLSGCWEWTPCDVHGNFCELRQVKEVLEPKKEK